MACLLGASIVSWDHVLAIGGSMILVALATSVAGADPDVHAVARRSDPGAETGDAAASKGDRTPPFRVRLNVDASALGPSGDVLAERIESRCTASLREADVALDEGGTRTLLVTIEPLPDAAVGYRTRVSMTDDGVPIPETDGSAECPLCTEEELLVQVEASVSRVVATVRAREAQAAQTHEDPAGPEPGPRAPPVAERQDREALGKLGRAGIGVAVVGVAVLGVGVGLAARPSTRLEDDPTRRLDTRPPGIALAISGGLVAAAGVVMLVVDAGTRSRKHRGPARVQVLPTWRGIAISTVF